MLMNIINNNKMTEQKEKYRSRKKNNTFRKFSASLMMIFFLASFFALVNGASADESTFEIPACVFEEQEGRTIVNFSDKKIVSHWSQEDAESEPVSVDMQAGSYKASLFSYDGYEGREGAFPQPRESWLAVLKNGDSVIAESSPIDDLEDWVQSATLEQIVNDDLEIDEDIDSIRALHVAYPDESSPNSVFPVCMAFDLLKLKEDPNHAPVIMLIGSTIINLIVGDIFTDPGATASDTEDGDITGDVVIGGDAVDTSIEGTYIITYNVVDSEGLAADEAIRTVIIAETSGDGEGGGSSSSASSEDSSSSEGGGTGGVGGDTENIVGASGGSSGRISFGGSRIMLPQVSLAGVSTSTSAESSSSSSIGQCSYLNDYLKLGEDNNPTEVLKLQGFLRVFENSDIPLTGVFDQATFDAVFGFQEKYREDILEPWGYDVPTGYVYITTKNKINEIFCGGEIPLSDEQKIEIEKVRTFIEEFGSTDGAGGSGSEGIGGDIGSAQGEDGEGADISSSEDGRTLNLAAGVAFLKSPMAFIIDNKLAVALIGISITLLIYLFSFKGSKI